jgi:hypothetical protein
MSLRSAATILLSLLAAACIRTAPPAPKEGAPHVPPPPIEKVVDRYAPELMKIPGVNMVYVGQSDDGKPCIRVGFVKLPSPDSSRVPQTLDGWPVVVEESGEIKPLSGN